MEHVLTSVLESKSEYQIQNTLIHNHCEHIEELVTINDKDIPYLRYPKYTQVLGSLSKGHNNLIHVFIN